MLEDIFFNHNVYNIENCAVSMREIFCSNNNSNSPYRPVPITCDWELVELTLNSVGLHQIRAAET